MSRTLRIMGVHGLGDHRLSDWKEKWPKTIKTVFPVRDDLVLDFDFISYDDIFEKIDISAWETMAAAAKLTASGVGSVFRRRRGVLGDISEKLRWTAGYVVAWVEDEGFKRQTRERVLARIREYQPDVILAHSLGSLITYNCFSHADAKAPEIAKLLARCTYVTLGSQINNPFVIRNLTNGRVQPLDVAFWHHLYNENDDVFTAPIRNWNAPNFLQTETPFDDQGAGDHAAESYLGHPNTVNDVWRPLGAAVVGAKAFGSTPSIPARSVSRKPARKALLVGINDYPDPANRLEGCVNDVFTMSSVLQECGFEPETIRVCLDDRATADGILSRLRWLTDGAQPGDELVFYYSGHGAQIPEYGENFEPDRKVETLVPWDFDWTPERAISDDQIWCMYSQLPYDTRLAMIFDCCHSGGIHRSGGARPKGITPPDDIRHRELKWDRETSMWVARDFKRINRAFTRSPAIARKFFGSGGSTERLGRAGMLRGTSATSYSRLKKTDPELAMGPYLPLIIEACGEDELSYEYRHGATSYGAFTWCLAAILRERKNVTFEDLVSLIKERLADLQYDQVPQILGPSIISSSKVPWRA